MLESPPQSPSRLTGLEAREVIRDAMTAGQFTDGQLVAYQQLQFNRWHTPSTPVHRTLNRVEIALATAIQAGVVQAYLANPRGFPAFH